MLREIMELSEKVFKADTHREYVEGMLDAVLLEIYKHIDKRIGEVEEKQGSIVELIELREQKEKISKELVWQGYETLGSLRSIRVYSEVPETMKVVELLKNVVDNQNKEITKLKEDKKGIEVIIAEKIPQDINLNIRLKTLKDNIKEKERQIKEKEESIEKLSKEIAEKERVEAELEQKLNKGIEEYTERIQNLEIEIGSLKTPAKKVILEVSDYYNQEETEVEVEGVEETEVEVEGVEETEVEVEGVEETEVEAEGVEKTEVEAEGVEKTEVEETEVEETEVEETEVEETEVEVEGVEDTELEDTELEEVEVEEVELEEVEVEETETIRKYGLDVLDGKLPGIITNISYGNITREVKTYRDILLLFYREYLRTIGVQKTNVVKPVNELAVIFEIGLEDTDVKHPVGEKELDDIVKRLNGAANKKRIIKNRVIIGTTVQQVEENKAAPIGQAERVLEGYELYITTTYNMRERREILKELLKVVNIKPDDVKIGLMIRKK